MNPSVEISILVYNQWASSRRAFNSLIRGTKYENHSITVLDNASTDGTHDNLKSFDFKVITKEKNIGFGPGHNEVMKASTADYLCLVNNDIEVSPGWLDEMVRVAEFDPAIGIVAPINRTNKRRSPIGFRDHAF